MNRTPILWLLLIPSLALAQINEVFTDAQAAHKAKALFKDAMSLRSEIDENCDTPRQLVTTSTKIDSLLEEWPNDHLKYRALFPYYACRQSLGTLSSYAMICRFSSYKGSAAAYDQRRWKEDITACKEAIKKPDLTLKDIE